MRRAPLPQLELFGVPHQAREWKPEPAELYLAILTLRKREHKVYRSGRRTHSIDGKRIWSDKMLLQLARAKA